MQLDRDNYRRARQVFHAACELPADARARFLDEACSDQPHIRREVESLFAQERRSLADALDQPLSEAGVLRSLVESAEHDVPASPSTELRVIGRYRLLERIGEGGFGVVFLAEQTEPVVRRVALKIVKSGMDSAQAIARFESERQALAMMDHPGIARVIDAGTTEHSRPYFVMELVHGEQVVRYCDRERLSVRQRLELFQDICGAVQHAHQKGIVHRDLKPTNVLVTVNDGKPLPKVIDFGIAKAIAGRLTDKSVLTELHQLIGTPQYMSPEQAAGSGVDIDTRSDIYALGVILYELLVGSTPLDDARVRSATLLELQRMIREDEPLRPSLRLSTSMSSETDAPRSIDGAKTPANDRRAADIARDRSTDPTKLVRLLRSDLDWIVMKCLEKDRTRRFATASALAEDIGRFLDHQPVLATPPSKSYRLRKFVQRNRAPVAAGATAALALTIAAGVSLAFGVSEARQREKAVDAKARAEKAEAAERERADELARVASFQQEQLSSVDVEAMGARLRERLLAQARAAASKSLTPADVDARIAQLEALIAESNFTGIALDALDENYFQPARAAIETQFGSQPLIQAQLLQTLASTMCALGLLDAAREPQETAIEIRRRELGDENRETISSIHSMALLCNERGELADAERYLREALAGYRRIAGDDDPSLLEVIASLGYVLKAKGDLAGAETYYREALEKQRRTLGDEHPDTLASINNMAALLMTDGKPEEAEPYFRSALATCRRALGDDDPTTLKAINSLGGVLQFQGKWAEAEPYYRESLERCLRVLGDRHSDTLTALNNLGGLLYTEGKLDEAEPYCREAVEKRRSELGDTHPKTLNSITNLAGLLEEQGKYGEAEELYREALELRRQTLEEDHPDVIASLNNLGLLFERMGKLADAELEYREALDKYRRVLGDGDRQTLIVIGNLCSLLHSQDRDAEALELLSPALPAMRRVFTGGNSMRLGHMLNLLGRCRTATRDFAAAEADLREADSILQKAENATDELRVEALSGLVALYDRWDELEPDHGHRVQAEECRARLAEARACRRE